MATNQKRYGVYLSQPDGCDYTIGCGRLFVLLPSSITDMDAAVAYVQQVNDDDPAYFDSGLPGSEMYSHVNACTIYEITAERSVPMPLERPPEPKPLSVDELVALVRQYPEWEECADYAYIHCSACGARFLKTARPRHNPNCLRQRFMETQQ